MLLGPISNTATLLCTDYNWQWLGLTRHVRNCLKLQQDAVEYQTQVSDVGSSLERKHEAYQSRRNEWDVFLVFLILSQKKQLYLFFLLFVFYRGERDLIMKETKIFSLDGNRQASPVMSKPFLEQRGELQCCMIGLMVLTIAEKEI